MNQQSDSASPPPLDGAVLADARLLYDDGKLDEARDLLEPIAEHDTTGASALMLARIAHRGGVHADTIRWAETIAGNPRVAIPALQLIGRAHNAMRDWPAAQAAWRRVTELNPAEPDAWLQRARAARRLEDWDDVATASAGGLALRTGDAELLDLAFEAAAARSDWSPIQALAPGLARSDVPALVVVVERLDREDRSIVAAEAVLAALDEIADRQPLEPLIARLVARMPEWADYHRAMQDDPGAARAWRLTLRLQPGHRQAAAALQQMVRPAIEAGREAQRTGDMARAARAYAGALELEPLHREANLALARIAENDGDWAAAARHWRPVADDSVSLARLARALGRSGEPLAALQVCRQAPASADIETAILALVRPLVLRGREHGAAEQIAEAREMFDAVLQIDPAHEEALRWRERLARTQLKAARTAFRDGDFAASAAHAAALRAAQPGDRDADLILARALMKLRRHADALPVWRTIAEHEPDYADAWLNLARCARRTKDWPLAFEASEALLALDGSHAEAAEIRAEAVAAV